MPVLATILAMSAVTAAAIQPPRPIGATPSPRQIEWHKLRYYAFIHFSVNTFTDREWGEGTEDPKLFNPTELNCDQWAQTFKRAGMKGIILTAKHHDGMCMWPSKTSDHTLAQSPFRGGKGDLVRELSDACKRAGLKFGVYISPWDRNHPKYGTDEYNDVFKSALRELLGNYGDIFEVWFDGANGEGPNGKKQVYDFPGFIQVVRELQPNAVIFSDAGPDVRWVGNEGGYSDPTCWSTVDRDRYVPGTPLYKELTQGKENGTHWVPAECDVSIRPGWFYHASQDDKVKSPETLLDLWFKSVGQNGSFLLNVPPDRRGLIHENDVQSLLGLKKLLDEHFAVDLALKAKVTASNTRGNDKRFRAGNAKGDRAGNYWATDEAITTASLNLDLGAAKFVDTVWIEEHIPLGQRVRKWKLECKSGTEWWNVANGTTIGAHRVLRFSPTSAQEWRLTFEDALGPICIERVSLYGRQ